MSSAAALVVECAVVSCTILGAGIMITMLDATFKKARPRKDLHSSGDASNGSH